VRSVNSFEAKSKNHPSDQAENRRLDHLPSNGD